MLFRKQALALWSVLAVAAVKTTHVSASYGGKKSGEGGIGGKKGWMDKDFELRIIHVNDHHSHIEPDEVEITPDDSFPSSLRGLSGIPVQVGGWPLLTSAIRAAEDDGEDMDMEVLKLHAGDAITGTIYYTLLEGKPDAEFMNSICFDAFALGNHEFDSGDDGLALFLDFLEDTNGDCYTPILAANVVPGPSSPLVGRLAPFEIFTFKGTKVGVIGLDTRLKTLMSSNPDEGTTILDEVAVATAQIAKLKEEGVDIIILLTHVGLDFDLTSLAVLPGVDVVVGGDSNTFMGYTAPVDIEESSREYPEYVFKPDASVACVVQAYQYSVLFGVLDIVFDDDGNVKSCQGNPIVPFDTSKSGLSYQQMDDLDNFLDGPFWKATEPDAKSTDDLAVFLAEAEVLKQTILATVPEDICFERIPGQGRSTICPCTDSEDMGGGVCNVVAKAFLEITPTADFALQNGGGCRSDISMGAFTVADAFTLLPFLNTLVTLDLTGQQVIDVLNEVFTFSAEPGASGAYPYGSGIRWSVQYPTPGVTSTTVEINPRLGGNWVAIDVGATYTVVTNSFIASGQDGYVSFLDAVNVVDTFVQYAQAFVEYATEVGTLNDLAGEEYSTQSISGGLMCA